MSEAAKPAPPAEWPETELDSPASQLHLVVRRLARGSALYALANFGIKALNFLLLPLYTRYLTPADYGTISLAEICAASVAAIFGLGLDAGITRLYFQYVDDQPTLARYLGSVLRFAIAVVAAVVTAALLAGPRLLAWLDPRFSVAFYPFIAMALGTAALTQVVQYRLTLYQSEGRAGRYGLLSLALFLMTASAAIALVVFARRGAEGMLLGKLLAAAVAALVALVLLARWLRAAPAWRFVRETLPLALPIVPHNLMALGLVVADRFILEHYRGLADVGIYSLAYTLGMVMFLVSSSIVQAWSPLFYDLARRPGESRPLLARMSSGVAVLLVGIAVFGSLLARDFVRLLDPRYAGAAGLIPWVIGGYLLHGFFSFLQLPVFQGKRTHFVAYTSALAFSANILLNLWWVPRWGAYGAAYATLAAYALEALAMYAYAQRAFPLAYSRMRVVGALAVFAACLALTQISWAGGARPLLMLAALALALLLLWGLGGREVAQDLRLLWKRTPGAS